MNPTIRKIFLQALEVILKPIIKYCIAHSIKYQDFAELTKRIFVKLAQDDVALRGHEISKSKLSVITGLRRREIDRILIAGSESLPDDGILTLRVIGQWLGDKRFLNGNGKPKLLELDGNNSEFAQLVKTVSRDINHRTVLFELERSGSVQRVGNKIKLITSVYVPKNDIRDGFALLSSDVKDLIAAGNENIFSRQGPCNLHAKTVYDNIPTEYESKIREWLLIFGGKVHQQVRKYLSQYDRDLNKSLTKKLGRVRVVLGTFSYIDQTTHNSRYKEFKAKKQK